MTGPRHLWSGDWEQESVEPDPINQQAQAEQGPPQEPQAPKQDHGSRWRRGRGQIAATAAAMLVVAGVAVGLTVALENNSSNPTAATSTSPTVSRAQAYSVPGPTSTTPSVIPPTGAQGLTQTQTQPVTQPPTSTRAQSSTIPNLPSINWLGMQIITGPSGPVVTTVTIGRAGDADGFEPEDIISTFDNKSVDSAVQISKIAAKLPLGSKIPIVVIRGSTQITIAATMKERPTIQP